MIVQQLFNGLTLGLTYSLIAVGYSLVFGILRLVNFSHGSIYAFGANIILMFVSLKWGIFPAIVAGVALTGVLGIAIDKVGLQPLRNQNAAPITSLITTVGISNIVTNLLIAAFGSQKRSFPMIFPKGSIKVAGMNFSIMQLGMFVVSLLLLLVLTLVVNKTKIGLAMRASQQNLKAARIMGVNVDFVISFTFLLGGVSAAIAGALISSYYGMAYPNMGYVVGLKAFAAAVLGGIGSLPGSIIGGLTVGVFETFAASTLGSEFRDSIAFVILIIVLVIRPQGFFGKKGINKV